MTDLGAHVREMHDEAAALAGDAKALLGHGDHEGWAFCAPDEDRYGPQRMYCGCGVQLLPIPATARGEDLLCGPCRRSGNAIPPRTAEHRWWTHGGSHHEDLCDQCLAYWLLNASLDPELRYHRLEPLRRPA